MLEQQLVRLEAERRRHSEAANTDATCVDIQDLAIPVDVQQKLASYCSMLIGKAPLKDWQQHTIGAALRGQVL